MRKRWDTFARSFVSLWRAQREAGHIKPRVARMAAMAAGYGGGSWCESRSMDAASVTAGRLLKRREIVGRISELGV